MDKKKGKNQKLKEIPIQGGVRLLNMDTGEIYNNATIAIKDCEVDVNFHKVWIRDLLAIFGEIGNSKVQTLTYLLNNTNPITNEFGGTIREIVEATGISIKTVQATINLVVEKGLFKKVRTATYMLNPDIVMKGNSNKHKALLIIYRTTGEIGSTPSADPAQAVELE
jgi:Firmicute plasmid replication protein (RepL)